MDWPWPDPRVLCVTVQLDDDDDDENFENRKLCIVKSKTAKLVCYINYDLALGAMWYVLMYVRIYINTPVCVPLFSPRATESKELSFYICSVFRPPSSCLLILRGRKVIGEENENK